jgi:hypothetical protein
MCGGVAKRPLADLPLEEILDLGNDAGGVGAALGDVALEPRGRVAAGAGDEG